MERLEAAIAAEPSEQQPPPPQPAEPAPAPAAPEPASNTTEPPQRQALPQEEDKAPQKPAEVSAEPVKPDEPPRAAPAATHVEPSPVRAAKEYRAPVQEQRPLSPPPEGIQVDEEPSQPPSAAQPAEPIEVDSKPSEPAPKSPSPARSEREGTPPPPTRKEKAEAMDVDDAPPSGPRASSALYITGLRRPLQATALASYLSSQAGTGSSDDDYDPPAIKGSAPFVSPSCPNLWLSGIKDHAYFRTWSVSAASAIKSAVDGKKWPEGDVNAGTLHVEFIPDGKVNEFAQQEEDGWRNGRQRFEVVQDSDGCRLQPFGKLKTGPPPPEPAGAARGLLGRLGERMGPGGRPPRGGVNTVPIRGRGGGPGGPMRWTRARPSLSWSTGPRA